MENHPAKRSFFKKSDLILILVLLVLAAAALIGLKLHQQKTAGETVWAVIDAPSGQYRLNLSEIEKNSLLDLQKAVGVPATLELESGKCRLINVDCPDHICEGFGWISASREAATCMPNRFVVGIYTQSELGNRMENAADISSQAVPIREIQ